MPLSAVTLFEPIREQDYIGYNGGIGSRGMDESVLDGYAIFDDAPAPTQHEDGGDCGVEFASSGGPV